MLSLEAISLFAFATFLWKTGKKEFSWGVHIKYAKLLTWTSCGFFVCTVVDAAIRRFVSKDWETSLKLSQESNK